jgi:hypothetical protein
LTTGAHTELVKPSFLALMLVMFVSDTNKRAVGNTEMTELGKASASSLKSACARRAHKQIRVATSKHTRTDEVD